MKINSPFFCAKIKFISQFIIALLVAVLLIISCENESTSGTNEDHDSNLSDSTQLPSFQMPRPRDWAIGTWVGTIPTPSAFAGKKVKLIIEEECGAVTGSIIGYYYKGSFTWDYQSSTEWTVNFKLPSSINDSYVWWVYDSNWSIETFRCEILSTNKKVALSTTTLGPQGTKPTTINLSLSVTIDGTTENDLVMLPLQKQ